MPNTSEKASSAVGGFVLPGRVEDHRSKNLRWCVVALRRGSSRYIELWTAPVPVRAANSSAIAPRKSPCTKYTFCQRAVINVLAGTVMQDCNNRHRVNP